MTEKSCVYKGKDEPRMLLGRHLDDCDQERCRGCQPCTDNHCVICRDEHVDERTCPSCVGTVRENLVEIVQLYATLPGHAVYAGNDSRLEAARPIPGGDATAMLAPSSDGRAAIRGQYAGRDATHRQDENDDEAMMPELALDTWEQDWRQTRGSEPSDGANLLRSSRYLLENLTWAAQHHDDFPAFAAEIRQQRARIEDVLHTGERPWLGAPCETCGRPLERVWAKAESQDSWWCDRCKISFRLGEYVENVARTARKHKAWLTPRDMEAEHDIPAGSIRGWGSRGQVRKRKDVNLGRMVYNVEDALQKRDTLEISVTG